MTKLVETRVINPRQYQPGTNEFGPAPLPVGTTYLLGRFSRSDLNTFAEGSLALEFFADISRDNGVTWNKFIDLRGEGGPRTMRDGNPRLWDFHKIFVVSLLSSTNPADANTLVRGRLVTYVRTSTEAWIEAYDDLTHTASGSVAI